VHVPEASLARDVVHVLDRLGISFALIGAAALAVRGLSRGTHDIDFMTTSTSAMNVDWTTELDAATRVDVRRGDHDDPLAGVVRISREAAADVDLVIGKWKWQEAMITRSEPVDLELFRVRVPDVADLVILKIDAGSYLDRRDAVQLLEIHGAETITTVDLRVRDLPRHVKVAWKQLKAEISPLT
jgi:hypothetical protein